MKAFIKKYEIFGPILSDKAAQALAKIWFINWQDFYQILVTVSLYPAYLLPEKFC